MSKWSKYWEPNRYWAIQPKSLPGPGPRAPIDRSPSCRYKTLWTWTRAADLLLAERHFEIGAPLVRLDWIRWHVWNTSAAVRACWWSDPMPLRSPTSETGDGRDLCLCYLHFLPPSSSPRLRCSKHSVYRTEFYTGKWKLRNLSEEICITISLCPRCAALVVRGLLGQKNTLHHSTDVIMIFHYSKLQV